ncbi:hypothetical protein ACKQTC_03605 [Peptococcus simiae]|uniref:TipAS antibiotic-recognition domain-containing protein n=1 Tax=Peptococcus simiae TaxID=1643805 RepID=A0ABW9GZ94_9FIRM
MKGHLELFENRLKAAGAKLPGADQLDMDRVFADFAAALGTEALPFYDVQSGPTLADYYQSHFIRFVKNALKA